MSEDRLSGPRPGVPSYGSVNPPSYQTVVRNPPRTDTRSQPTEGGDFESKSRRISNLIFKINSNASSLDRVSKNVGARDEDGSLRSKIHELQQDTNSVAGEVASLLKQLAVGDDRSRKLQVERLSRSFQEAVQRYSGIQKRIAEKVRAGIKSAADDDYKSEVRGSRRYPDEESDRAALVEGRRAQLQAQALAVEDDLASAVDRAERLRQLEADILDVNSIFRDLAVMVNSQGEMIDDIEANVTKAADSVVEGNVQLVQAAKHQKAARKKMCCLVGILVVVLAIIGIILGVTLGKR